MRRSLAILAMLCLAAPALGQLQVRAIPAEAKRGVLRHVQESIVQIDGRSARLSPGAQVRDARNRIVVPTAIPAGSLVKYTVGAQGEVSAVWILTEQEAAR
jgi:hypothetical protein